MARPSISYPALAVFSALAGTTISASSVIGNIPDHSDDYTGFGSDTHYARVPAGYVFQPEEFIITIKGVGAVTMANFGGIAAFSTGVSLYHLQANKETAYSTNFLPYFAKTTADLLAQGFRMDRAVTAMDANAAVFRFKMPQSAALDENTYLAIPLNDDASTAVRLNYTVTGRLYAKSRVTRNRFA